MDKIEEVILLGIEQFGRQKTFAEILDAAGLHTDDSRRLEAANGLESSGLIQDVSYQLPLTIRASLSPSGEAYVRSLKSDASTNISDIGIHTMLIFLQLNLALL
jgi:hypothetical protein